MAPEAADDSSIATGGRVVNRGRALWRFRGILWMLPVAERPAALPDRAGDETDGQRNQGGQQNHVVQIPQKGDEVGDEINGRQGVSDGDAGAQLGNGRCFGCLNSPMIFIP